MEEFDDIIELIDDEGEEVSFRLVDVIEYRDDTYLALEAVEDEDEASEEAEIVFMLVTRDEKDEDCYEPVLDDDMNEALFEIFMQHMEETEEEEDGEQEQ
ncbi:MAG: DUF1292 domain-containing protein [Clostridia bacterium]|nr:DUF1292 domain-containing protein [Clostridia bacterium]